MGKESKGILEMFRRNRPKTPEERLGLENPDKKSKTKKDRSRKLGRIFKPAKASEDCRELTMAETYDMMCRSLAQFVIEAGKHERDIEAALAKCVPSNSKFADEAEHRGCGFDTLQSKNMPGLAAKLKNVSSDGNRGFIYAVETDEEDINDMGDFALSADDYEEDDTEESDEDTGHAPHVDGYDSDDPKWRGRSKDDVIDVHELLTPGFRSVLVSPYCRRYLDLASYIPPLSTLCKAVIKARISSNATCRKPTVCENIHQLAQWKELHLPSWLTHESLGLHVPPAVINQMTSIMLSGNLNNNRPASKDESENNNGIVVTKSKYPMTVHIPTGDHSSRENKSPSKHREASTSTERKGAKRKCNRYFLAPIGSISTQGLPSKGFPKWMDVATIVHQGTYAHRNLKPSRESPHTTLEPDMLTPVLAKLRCYSVRPLKMPMTCLKSLMDINAKSSIFAETHAKFVCVNLLMALQFLHSRDIFHGSVCPAKIVLNDKGYPSLTGFGAAEIIDDRQGRPRERQELAYTSPEQLILDYVTEVTDIFSLGAVVYAMVYGRPPHQGADYAETRRNLLAHKFIPAFELEELSSEGRHFLTRCLRKNDRRRFSLLHQKRSFFETVDWFQRLHEDKLYRQTIPSPMLYVMKKLVE